MNRCLLFLIAVAVLPLAAPSRAARRTLTYGPRVQLQGRLRRVVFPGPPNYTSVDEGDTPETCLILELSAPIDVKAKPGDDFEKPRKNVRDLQLAPSPEQYRKASKLVGKRVTVSGTLFGEHTAHHHTPVLISVESIRAGR